MKSYWLGEFQYDNDWFDVEYDFEGEIVSIELRVGMGFVVDFISVTEAVSDNFREMCKKKIFDKIISADKSDKVYDDSKENNGDAA